MDFFQLQKNEEELNRIIIPHYGLQEELMAEVPLKDVTILQEELDSSHLEALEDEFRAGGGHTIELPIKRDVVMQQFLSYCIGLMMGRYRLDQPGLTLLIRSRPMKRLRVTPTTDTRSRLMTMPSCH